MNSSLLKRSLLVVALFFGLCTCMIYAQEKVKYFVKISTPQQGDNVGKDGRVRGTAAIPSNSYLWVLSHMKDLTAEWWPQGGRPAIIDQNGNWVIIAAYGREEDRNQEFEVAAVVVDANTNNLLLKWVGTAKSLDYPPIAFPNTISDCLPVKVIVLKTSH